jgi:hypothetical protein
VLRWKKVVIGIRRISGHPPTFVLLGGASRDSCF